MTETKREKIKDAVRRVLEENGAQKDQAYELACQVADEMESS